MRDGNHHTAGPENTTDRDPLIHLLGAMSDGMGGYVEGMEAVGQRQLVHSDRLPADAGDGDAAYLALGFTFGSVDPADRLFRPATLPQGWTRKPSDHSLWSYIVDELGRKRVSIFYKAAFYDRSAFMRLQTVSSYVSELLRDGGKPVLDDTWCTRDAVGEALTSIRARHEERLDLYASRVNDPSVPWAAEELATTRGELAKLDAFAAALVVGESE